MAVIPPSPPMLESNLPSLKRIHQGKVRDIYEVDADHMLIVTTDRLSAFDVVMPDPIPGKGAILTRISRFWFERTQHIVPNHLTDIPLESVVSDKSAQPRSRCTATPPNSPRAAASSSPTRNSNSASMPPVI